MQMTNKNLIDAYNSAKTHNEKIFQLDCLQHKERIIESIKSALSKFKWLYGITCVIDLCYVSI